MSEKVEHSYQLNEDQVSWLKAMAEKYKLPDESKALRVALDYAAAEGDEADVFTNVRCHHC